MSESLNALPPGTVVCGYVIDSELGGGGFSIVYLARHQLKSDWLYAIKEYFPRKLAVRTRDGVTVHPVNTHAREAFEDGLRRFTDEAEQLRKFRNEPHIVSCVNYCEQNGTAYLVMDYDDGLPLSDFLRRREKEGQPFTEKDLLAVVKPLLAALTVVHRAGVLHRDIKPDNIFVRRQDGITGRPAQPVLIDFGAAKQNYLERHSRSQAPHTPGYAAFEQTSSLGEIGPWTDLYALGASMWRMVAGGCPGDSRLLLPDESNGTRADEFVWNPSPREVGKRAYALNREWADPMPPTAEVGAGKFSPHVLKAIDRCLALYPEDRAQNCEELQSLLLTQSTSEDAAGINKLTLVNAFDAAKEACGRFDYEFARREFSKLGEQGYADAQYELGVMFHGGSGIGVANDLTQAVRWFARAAEQGHSEAQYELGRMHYVGEGVQKDELQAIKWFTRAAEQGYDDACLILDYIAAEQGDPEYQYEMGRMFDVEMYDEKKFNAFDGNEWYGIFDEVMAVQSCEILAEDWYRRAAEQGHAKAQRELSVLYANGGDFVDKNLELANDWLTRAAESGDADALHALSEMYTSGEAAPKDNDQAVRWFKLFAGTAEQGTPDSQYALGKMYASGEGVPQDQTQAVTWFTRAAQQDHTDAQNWLGMMYDFGEGVAQDHKLAMDWYKRAADQGLATAQFNLGNKYKDGAGVPRDHDQAAHWYTCAAEQGDARAQFELGEIYEQRNIFKAIQYYTDAAEGGVSDAQLRLGEIHRYGLYGIDGVKQDIWRAKDWFELAAEQGDANAQFELGLMYCGKGNSDYWGESLANWEFSLDDSIAVQWFTRAAKEGHRRAQFMLSDMYFDGKGVHRDSTQALDWLTRAADNGHVPAQLDLARRYHSGEDVSIDLVQAVQWYAHAAERGNTSAQLSLSRMYLSGDGVEADIVKAYAWANLASVQGSAWADHAVALRDEIAASLSPVQLATSKELSSELEARILEVRVRDVHIRLGQIQSSS